MYEIERRYLIRLTESDRLRSAPASKIRQGYLTAVEPAVRVRESGGAYVLTVKTGQGRVRREVEVPVDEESGRALMEMAGRRIVEKTRYRLGRWEIDVFEGKLQGLILAEIELDHANETVPAPAGIALVREVTHDVAFTNQRLAHLSPPEAAALARWVGRG